MLIKMSSDNGQVLEVPRTTVRWEISDSLIRELQTNKATSPFLVIMVASCSKGSLVYQRIWHYESAPLFKKCTELTLPLPGKYEIYYSVIWDKYGGQIRPSTIRLYDRKIEVELPTQQTYFDGVYEIEALQDFFCKSDFEKWLTFHPTVAKIFRMLHIHR